MVVDMCVYFLVVGGLVEILVKELKVFHINFKDSSFTSR